MAEANGDPPDGKGSKTRGLSDETYTVGKGKPPESGKFRVGDGRPRGRRPKGTRNLAMDFREEMQGLVTVTLNGKQKRVSKQRSLVMRLIDNAGRGQNGALKLALEYGGKFGGAPDISVDAAATQGELLPDLGELTSKELREFHRLLSKAAGKPMDEGVPNMFAHRCDPEDPRNYISERTVDGLVYDRSLVDNFPDRLKTIENGAYRSAASPRLPGCNRRQY